MTGKYSYCLVLLILISSSCNTFNNVHLFSSRQGKNKIIDRDFETQNDFEVTNQVSETEQVQKTIEFFEHEGSTIDLIKQLTSAVINNEDNLNEPFEIVADNYILKTSSKEAGNVTLENVIQTKQDSQAPITNDVIFVVLILILAAFVLLLVIGFFSLVESWF